MFSVLFMAAMALIVTLPALIGDENNYTYAFYAVVSITVIGLYIAYVIPTYLRWRQGDSFVPGPWTLGQKYKWVNPAAVIWVIICVIVFSLPQGAAGAPWADEFDWKYVNYAPFTVAAVIIAVGAWWLISARHTFKGPIRQLDTDDTGRVIDPAPSQD
jgi:amino acid transporter